MWTKANDKQAMDRFKRCPHKRTSTNRSTQDRIIVWCKDCGRVINSIKR